MTQKAYRSSKRPPSKNSGVLSFPVNPDHPRSYCLLCGNSGWRPVTYRGSTAVVVCVCRGGRRDVQPVEDFKSLAGGGERG